MENAENKRIALPSSPGHAPSLPSGVRGYAPSFSSGVRGEAPSFPSSSISAPSFPSSSGHAPSVPATIRKLNGLENRRGAVNHRAPRCFGLFSFRLLTQFANGVALSSILKKPFVSPGFAIDTEPVERALVALPLIGRAVDGVIL